MKRFVVTIQCSSARDLERALTVARNYVSLNMQSVNSLKAHPAAIEVVDLFTAVHGPIESVRIHREEE